MKKKKDFWRLNLIVIPSMVMGSNMVERLCSIDSTTAFLNQFGLLVVLTCLALGFSYLLVHKLGLKFNKA